MSLVAAQAAHATWTAPGTTASDCATYTFGSTGDRDLCKANWAALGGLWEQIDSGNARLGTGSGTSSVQGLLTSSVAIQGGLVNQASPSVNSMNWRLKELMTLAGTTNTKLDVLHADQVDELAQLELLHDDQVDELDELHTALYDDGGTPNDASDDQPYLAALVALVEAQGANCAPEDCGGGTVNFEPVSSEVATSREYAQANFWWGVGLACALFFGTKLFRAVMPRG